MRHATNEKVPKALKMKTMKTTDFRLLNPRNSFHHIKNIPVCRRATPSTDTNCNEFQIYFWNLALASSNVCIQILAVNRKDRIVNGLNLIPLRFSKLQSISSATVLHRPTQKTKLNESFESVVQIDSFSRKICKYSVEYWLCK